MELIRPELTPKTGYVERVDAEGNHYYAPTAQTLAEQQKQEAQQQKQEAQQTIQDDMDSLAADHEYRLTLLELGLTEA